MKIQHNIVDKLYPCALIYSDEDQIDIVKMNIYLIKLLLI